MTASESGLWRVKLRPTRLNDADTVDSWLGEAIAAVEGRPASPSVAPTLAEFLGGLKLVQEALTVVGAEDRPLGLLILGHPAAAIPTLDWLAIEVAHRNLGFGAEAIYALEERVPNRALIGRVSAANGLAIYFWLRAGYRPIYPRPRNEEFSSEYIWMTRHTGGRLKI